jgi:transcription elongation GreA/GreB family factor
MMGHSAGETVSYQTPTGAVLEVEIVSVEG